MQTFLSTSDVAKLARRSPDAVRIWERRGLLRAVRTLGGIRLFARKDVDQFLKARRLAVERVRKDAKLRPAGGLNS